MSAFIGLIIFGIPLLSLAWWFWADRRLRALSVHPAWRIGLSLGMVILLSGFGWIILSRREVVIAQIPAELYALVLLWGLIFLPLLAVPSMVGWSVWSLAKRIFFPRKAVAETTEERQEKSKWSRRRVLGALATSLPLLATLGTGAFSLPRITRFRVRNLTVSLKELPEALDGIRIAHITDTHVGKFTRGQVLDQIVATTNSLEADLVLFTGDLIDNSIRDLPIAVRMMQQLKAKSGVFLIEGNHDLFEDAVAFEKGVRDGGITMLRNEVASVQVRGSTVQLLGIVWKHGEEEMAEDVDTVSAMRDPAAFPILLAHHPHAFDRAAERGIPLTLAGHTHGGQLMLSQEIGAGPAMFRYWSGLYRKAERALVVGNGTGNWFPLRLNAPAEIIHLTLRRA